MNSRYTIVIVGGGPAGLACAKVCAEHGASVAVFERKNHIGSKVCAGGITWNGLLQRFGDISQCTFCHQRIVTPRQSIRLCEKTPIIATVNREELGRLMAGQASDAGAEIYQNCQVLHICNGEIVIRDDSEEENGKKQKTIQYEILVGADGSNSMVRRYLAIPSANLGIGINYQLNILRNEMEWHLAPPLFSSSYAWIFPHRTTTSVGAYVDMATLSAYRLKNALSQWAQKNGIPLTGERLQAGTVNFDYQGVEFSRIRKIFLAGDAAGLASGLTGEGIYPAIVSGEYVGRKIFNSSWKCEKFSRLEKKHARHRKVVLHARNHPGHLSLLSELYCFLLRSRLISFSTAEMASRLDQTAPSHNENKT